jgi:hypothetical protein
MEFASHFVWCCMGYASEGERVGELVRTKGTLYCFGNMKVDSFMFYVMYLERAKCKEL